VEAILEGSFFMSSPAECFHFQIAKTDGIGQNQELSFEIQADWFVDGIGCWMEVKLFDNVEDGILKSITVNQCFLPFPARMRCQNREILKVNIAIVLRKKSAWIEWSAWTARFCVPIQNPGGTAFRVSID
jgi:hypothetical protein